MASNNSSHAEGMPQLDFSTFPNQIFWMVVFCVILFAVVKIFIIPRMEDIFANRRKVIDGSIFKAEEIKQRVEEIELQIEKELSEAKAQCNNILQTSNDTIKNQINLALEDSKKATAEIIQDAEKRLKVLRDGSDETIKKLSDELVSEIINKVIATK
tara:strand:+ start:962 stop:1432 length:471 start_codon:yes stop_codon:yes gene_type:complete